MPRIWVVKDGDGASIAFTADRKKRDDLVVDQKMKGDEKAHWSAVRYVSTRAGIAEILTWFAGGAGR